MHETEAAAEDESAGHAGSDEMMSREQKVDEEAMKRPTAVRADFLDSLSISDEKKSLLATLADEFVRDERERLQYLRKLARDRQQQQGQRVNLWATERPLKRSRLPGDGAFVTIGGRPKRSRDAEGGDSLGATGGGGGSVPGLPDESSDSGSE